jgi:hypothetical protein
MVSAQPADVEWNCISDLAILCKGRSLRDTAKNWRLLYFFDLSKLSFGQ